MPRPRNGFTILEVVIALFVLSVGVLGFVATLAPSSRLAARGRVMGRAALWLESRRDRLRAEVLRSGTCTPPAAGSAVHGDGITETWSALGAAGAIELRMTAASAGVSETVFARMVCP